MWSYHNPVRIHFGIDSFETVSALVGSKNYLLVTYDEKIFHTLSRRLEEKAGAPSVIINNIDTNPDLLNLEIACERMANAKSKPEVIVAIGGGSIIDTAKVMAVGANGLDSVKEYLSSSGKSSPLPEKALPLVSIPTTAGTGSEVTCWATVWDSENKKKYSLARHDLYPMEAVIDPKLMAGMPKKLTVSTGLDALSHSLESIWNVNANPVSTNYAIDAARRILRYLGPLLKDLENLELRSQVAIAATMAGLAISNTKTALAHSLSYPLTLNHSVPHGIACSFSLPGVMRSIIGVSAACDEALCRIFGSNLKNASGDLAKFLENMGVSTDYSSYGVSESVWVTWVEEAISGERGRNFIGRKDSIIRELLVAT